MAIYISRRKFIKSAGAAAALSFVGNGLIMRLALAATENNKRLFVIILRGALDGMAAVIPYGDRNYADARGPVALPQDADNLINLDGYFAMNTALKPLADLYGQKQLLVMHAVATPYRERSHFDAQNLLEIGSTRPHTIDTGWLNRAVGILPQKPEALAIGQAVPQILRGDAKVTSWSPSNLPEVSDDFLNRVRHMYQSDAPMLDTLNNALSMQGADDRTNSGRGPRSFVSMMQKAASFMAPDNGLRIGTIDIGGWDTHTYQKGLTNTFGILAEGIRSYQTALGDTWKNTAVLVVTEFGRTVKGNGTGGTDHGTGTVAFLMGGSVAGGRVIGDWPGLAKLYQDRDLTPANDLRALLKATLDQHLGINEEHLANIIFPESRGVGLREKLFIA